MCGIAGVLNLNGSNIVVEKLIQLSDSMDAAMSHRGPDAFAHKLVNNQLLFLHRRLSIIGLGDQGNQPMESDCGNFVIVYNGEIFNYRELSKRYGFTCVTGTDTEVLLQGWRLKGLDFVSELDGFFAFAIWDKSLKTLMLVRDKTGVKPLYYQVFNNILVFGSEERSVIRGVAELGGRVVLNNKYASTFLEKGITESQAIVNIDGIGDVFDHNEESLGLKEVAAGSVLLYKKVAENWQKSVQFWFEKSFLDWRGLFDKASLDWQELLAIEPQYKQVVGVFNKNEFEVSDNREVYLLNSILHLSIARRLRSDVPLGFAVSGGIDSAVLVAIAARLMQLSGGVPKVFSVQSLGDENDESYWQKLVVDRVGGDWEIIDTANLEAGILDAFISKTGRPAVHWNNLAHFAMCKRVKDSGVTVLFNGQGADEIFAGYPHYYVTQLFREFTGLLPSRDRWPIRFSSALKQRVKHFVKRFMGNESAYPTSLAASLDQDYFGQRLNQLLRFEDRNGMAFALESRNPFADDYYLYNWLMAYGLEDANGVEWNLKGELTSTQWNGMSKGVLRQVALMYLPEELVYRTDKKGFTVAAEKLTKRCYSTWMHTIKDDLVKLNLSENWKKQKVEEIEIAFKKNQFDRAFRLISWLKYLIYLNQSQLVTVKNEH